MSLINTKIKPFKNQAFKNGEFIEITEKDTEGRWSVFFFYPADFTFVCPTELGDVADHYEELQKLGVDVYAVSTDTHFTHKAWHSSSETIAKIKYAIALSILSIHSLPALLDIIGLICSSLASNASTCSSCCFFIELIRLTESYPTTPLEAPLISAASDIAVAISP